MSFTGGEQGLRQLLRRYMAERVNKNRRKLGSGGSAYKKQYAPDFEQGLEDPAPAAQTCEYCKTLDHDVSDVHAFEPYVEAAVQQTRSTRGQFGAPARVQARGCARHAEGLAQGYGSMDPVESSGPERKRNVSLYKMPYALGDQDPSPEPPSPSPQAPAPRPNPHTPTPTPHTAHTHGARESSYRIVYLYPPDHIYTELSGCLSSITWT